jgi:hypothetical protein
MLQKVFKSVIIAWLLLLGFCLFGGFDKTSEDHKIIIALAVIPFAGGLAGFAGHLLDKLKSKLNLTPINISILKVSIFVVLVGMAFILGLNDLEKTSLE